MLKHSSKDSCFVFILLVQLALLVVPFVHHLSDAVLIFLIFMNIFLMGTNYQCVAHNFIHLPFFKSSFLNNLFSIFNSIGIGVPQSLYRLHQLNHHRHNNHPEFDASSTLRHGKNGKEENIASYSFLGVVRTDLVGLFKAASKHTKLPWVELGFLLFVLALALGVNSKLFLIYLLPSLILGQVFALWENYCEHHHANHLDRKRDSVSCYNPFYNWIWFNNGYHQEHHFSPQVHWAELPKVKDQLPADRVIVKGCHLTNSV
jgi:fatty acid desaturase